jgi:glycine betaine/proline transport system permease protein
VLDAMQTMPSFVYLIPAMMFFGLGKVPAMFATIIYAIPPIIRLTNVGIREVDYNVVEAASAFGSSYWQVLFNVELPLAKPAIMVGINQTTMMALAMVVVASMIGAKGLVWKCFWPSTASRWAGIRGRSQHRVFGDHHRPPYPCRGCEER